MLYAVSLFLWLILSFLFNTVPEDDAAAITDASNNFEGSIYARKHHWYGARGKRIYILEQKWICTVLNYILVGSVSISTCYWLK